MRELLSIFALFFAIFTISACDNNKNSDTSNTKELTPINKESPLVIHTQKEQEDKKQEQKILNKMGIDANGEKITIDINKTKSFLNHIAKTFEKKAKKIEDKTKNLDSSDLGIKVGKDKIEIDINKTKSFLDQFSKELEGVAKDIDREINK